MEKLYILKLELVLKYYFYGNGKYICKKVFFLFYIKYFEIVNSEYSFRFKGNLSY